MAILQVSRPHCLRHGDCVIIREPDHIFLGISEVREVMTMDGPALKLTGSPYGDDWADPQFVDFLAEGNLRTKTHVITLYEFRDEYYVRGLRPGNKHKAALDRRYFIVPTGLPDMDHSILYCWMSVVIYKLDPACLRKRHA